LFLTTLFYFNTGAQRVPYNFGFIMATLG